MSRTFIKKALRGTSATILLLLVVLGIHIYLVTKPQINEKTVAMARIDIKQDISTTEASSIENWLSAQNGVDHVVYNGQSKMLVFTFYPIKTNASALADNIKTIFHVNAERFMPSAEQMASGCPAMSHTFSGKVYAFVTHIFNQH